MGLPHYILQKGTCLCESASQSSTIGGNASMLTHSLVLSFSHDPLYKENVSAFPCQTPST